MFRQRWQWELSCHISMFAPPALKAQRGAALFSGSEAHGRVGIVACCHSQSYGAPTEAMLGHSKTVQVTGTAALRGTRTALGLQPPSHVPQVLQVPSQERSDFRA